MPVIEFTETVGTRFKPGDIANLPLSTLKGLAQEAGLEAGDWGLLGKVRAQGAGVHDFMRDEENRKRVAQAVESEPKRGPGRPRKDATAI